MNHPKFRIWDKKKKRWFHGNPKKEARDIGTDAISLFGEVIIMGEILRDQNTDEVISLLRVNDLVPVQSIGVKDKNGIEIFEGDIVTTDYPTVKNMSDNWTIERGHTGMHQLAVGSFKYSIHELVHNKWKLEILGNIYENKELLNER